MKPGLAAATVPQSKGKKNAYSNSVQKMTCPYCPRVFPWASSLQRHMLTHTGNVHADVTLSEPLQRKLRRLTPRWVVQTGQELQCQSVFFCLLQVRSLSPVPSVTPCSPPSQTVSATC